MLKIAVILYGSPGSGKSTQAELIAKKYGLIFFDTGKYIASVIYNPKNKNNKKIQQQKKLYESGALCDRPWIFRIVATEIKRIIKAGYGLIIAGSPRGEYEAFDSGKRKGVYSILKDAYGKDNIFTFYLTVDPKIAVSRNSKRKICKICDRAYLAINKMKFKTCPFCEAQLEVRKDDNIVVMKKRFDAFENETLPILTGLKKLGFIIRNIKGEELPYQVFNRITKWLPK